MSKISIFFLLILIAAFSLRGVPVYADEDKDERTIKPSRIIETIENPKVFEISGEGKNRTEFRIKNNHNDEDSEFMIKGVINASTSNSITIDTKVINIDPLITKEIKIVGNIKVGAYAMVKGKIIDSKYYAQKIVINQRNRNNIEDENENSTPSATPTPTLRFDDNENETATMTAKLDFGNIINTIQNFLNYLIGIASRI